MPSCMGLHRVGHDWSDLAAAALGLVKHHYREDTNYIPDKKKSTLLGFCDLKVQRGFLGVQLESIS